jgi:hypothetical protein
VSPTGLRRSYPNPRTGRERVKHLFELKGVSGATSRCAHQRTSCKGSKARAQRKYLPATRGRNPLLKSFNARRDGKEVNPGLLDGVDSRRDSRRVRFQFRPVAAPEEEHGELPSVEVLLVDQVLVGGHEDFKARPLREREEIAVFLCGPAELKRTVHLVVGGCACKGLGTP